MALLSYPEVTLIALCALLLHAGKTVMVRAGEDPSQALSKAACGDTIQLQAGATFDLLPLPSKNCDDSHWIIVRTSAPDSKLPPEGTRLTPCYAGVSSLPGRPALSCASTENVLAKIEYKKKGGSGPILIAPGANHYRLIGLEVTRAPSPTIVYNLVGPTTEHRIILSSIACGCHGTHRMKPCGELCSATCVSWQSSIPIYRLSLHRENRRLCRLSSDRRRIGDDPMGPFKIVNNFLEAAAESIEFGGGQANATPTDIEIRRNHFFKPVTWLKGQPGFVGGVNGNPFIVKNLFELKNAQRVLFEGNVLENTWGGFSQVDSQFC